MYYKSTKGLLKHIDFMILDLICLELSFYIAFSIRQKTMLLFEQVMYRNMMLILLLVQVAVVVFLDTFEDVLKRGYYKELFATVKNVVFILLFSSAYLFMTQQGDAYSRFVWLATGGLYFLLSYFTRLLWKHLLKIKRESSNYKLSLLIISSKKNINEVVRRIEGNNLKGFYIAGIAIMDDDCVGDRINGNLVVANRYDVVDFAGRMWIDEVFIDFEEEPSLCTELIDNFVLMGITVHLNLPETGKISGKSRFVEEMSSYTVFTYSINNVSLRQVIAKRAMDICGGIVGCILTLILMVIIGPIIYIQSPGPIFFSQERIGRNGKKFKLYKFRSMYPNAEERKKELIESNKIKDGFMFKMDNDPRIIGSEKGPGKGIGNFIRRTSIDEFPQFFNVLKGDMSLVGTRPPLPSEYEKYDLHHKARLAINPGITGMWQISGRSNITDFEEVVKSDVEYIENWSIALDLKILVKTVGIVLNGDGAI